MGPEQQGQAPQGGQPAGGDQVQQMAVQIIKAIMEGKVSLQDIMNDPNIPSTVKKIVMAYIQQHGQEMQQAQQQQGAGQAPAQPMQ